MQCPYCGSALSDTAKFCTNCGAPVASASQSDYQPPAYGQPSYGPNEAQYQQPGYYAQPAVPANSKSKIAAGLLAILLGTLGIHKFYLGYTKAGVIMLLVSLLTLGLGAFVMEIIGLIEGIMYLTKSDWDFYQTYVVGEKQWF